MNYKKILIAVENGATAEKVALAGFQLGKQLTAEIALVSIAETNLPVSDNGITPQEMTEIIKKDLKKTQELLVENVFGEHKVWTFIEEGNPHEMILKIADEWDADLIVAGTHGRTGLLHLFAGSVAEKIIRHSVKPVFVVPTK